MDSNSDSPRSHYEKKLYGTREKYLPVLEILVGKFSEYTKIWTALREQRPSLEWLDKLEATCEKIQKRMTKDFFEKTHEVENKSQSKLNSTIETGITESNENETNDKMHNQKLSRWDVKPSNDWQNNEKFKREKEILKDDGDILKNVSVHKNRHKTEKGLSVIDLTKNVKEHPCRQKTRGKPLKETKESDSDVEIIASIAGNNPLRRVKSQTQFATLEEVNKSTFYRNFTSDNMILDSQAANLKHGTVFDLIKNKSQTGGTQNRKYPYKRSESLSKRPVESEILFHRRKYENTGFHDDTIDRKASLTRNKPHVSKLVNEKNYKHLQSVTKYFDRNNGSKTTFNSRRSDDSYLSTNFGKSGNEFQGKMPFYKHNISRNFRYSYPEKSFTPQSIRNPLLPIPPEPYPALSESYPPIQSLKNTKYNSVGFQSCSFHCSCCKNTPHFSSLDASYQPTTSCVVGNNNYTFFSGQYFPNQPIVPPSNTNLPTPFPTYTIPTPLPPSTALLASSIPPYSEANKSGYSVPVFCDKRGTNTSIATPSPLSCNCAKNIHHQELSRNILENSIRQKDPRKESAKEKNIQNTPNIAQSFKAIDSTLSSSFEKPPRFSGISEEKFSQSCTFLRPDNLYTDFKCNSNDFRNNSSQSLKSFGLLNNITNGNVANQSDLHKKSVVINTNLFNHSGISQNDISERNKYGNEKYLNLQSMSQTEKRKETKNSQDKITENKHDNTSQYISPLSNLYSVSNSKSRESTPVINKQIENRKRKFNEVTDEKFSIGESKKRCNEKVSTTIKTSHVGNNEYLMSKPKQYSIKKEILNNYNGNECNKVDISPRSDDTDLSTELWETVTSPTKGMEKDCQSQSYKTTPRKEKSTDKEKSWDKSTPSKIFKEQKSKPHASLTNKFQPSFDTPVPKKQKSSEKDNLLQTDISCNKPEIRPLEANSPYSVQLQASEKVSVHNRVKLDFKTKSTGEISSIKKIERNTENNPSRTVELLPSENMPVSLNEKPCGKVKLFDKNTGLQKSTADKEKYTRTYNHQKDKSGENENILGKNCSSHKTVISNYRYNNKTPTPSKDSTSSVKEKCFEKYTYSKKPTTCHNKNPQIAVLPQKEKSFLQEKHEEPCSFKDIVMDICVNTNSKHISQGIKSNTKEFNSSSKKSTAAKLKDCSVILKREKLMNKGKHTDSHTSSNKSVPKKVVDNKPKPVRLKSHSKEKCLEKSNNSIRQIFDKPNSSNKAAAIKDKCTDNNVSSEKSIKKRFVGSKSNLDRLRSHDKQKLLEMSNDSLSKISNKPNCTDKSAVIKDMCTDNNVSLDKSINKRFVASKSKPERLRSHDKQKLLEMSNDSLSKISDNPDCTDKAAVIKGKYTANNVSLEKSIHKKFVDNKTSTGKLKLLNNERFLENENNSKGQESYQSSFTDKEEILQREKELENQEIISKNTSNDENDKVKDLVLKMKSLSQSEALKVISEFAFMLKADESLQSTHSEINQKVPLKEKEMLCTIGQTIIKDEIIIVDDYIESLIAENNTAKNIIDNPVTASVNASKIIVCNNSNNNAVPLEFVTSNFLNSCETKQNKTESSSQNTGANTENDKTLVKSNGTTLKSHGENFSEKLHHKTNSDSLEQKQNPESFKYNKKEKWCELDKIHGNLDSCFGLDDVMKCSVLRSCRLKNELDNGLKESVTYDQQIKKMRMSDFHEEPFFIEDEITIKMEPIPELSLDFIKEEPDFFQ